MSITPGTKFRNLVVLEEAAKHKYRPYHECRCSACGKHHLVAEENLLNGSAECGCEYVMDITDRYRRVVSFDKDKFMKEALDNFSPFKPQ